jgi:hypothetical protein
MLCADVAFKSLESRGASQRRLLLRGLTAESLHATASESMCVFQQDGNGMLNQQQGLRFALESQRRGGRRIEVAGTYS